ncbi:hypothetical protein V6N13_088473 [Hibiscus sabdariffa]
MEAMDWWHCLKWVSHLKSPELQEDLIATVLNISTVDNNKELVAEHHAVIPLLAVSMRFGTIVTKRNAAAALFTL